MSAVFAFGAVPALPAVAALTVLSVFVPLECLLGFNTLIAYRCVTVAGDATPIDRTAVIAVGWAAADRHHCVRKQVRPKS